MADNTTLNVMTGGDVIATDDISSVKFQRVKLIIGANGVNDGDVASGNPLPVTGALTDTQLRATPVPVSGTVTATTGGLTDTQLRASAVPISVAATLTTKETRSATATTSQVADTASNATLLALNANRLGASIANDSSAALFVKLGTTATTSDYTVRLVQYAYYEVPFGYTGRIDGIWATDPGDGAARITELT